MAGAGSDHEEEWSNGDSAVEEVEVLCYPPTRVLGGVVGYGAIVLQYRRRVL